MLLQAALLLGATWVMHQIYKRFIAYSPLDRIPGPRRSSLLSGNMKQLMSEDGWAFHEEISTQYGGVTKLWGFLGDKKLYVYDPLALYHILMKDQYTYTLLRGRAESRALFVGRGLLTVYGAQHKQQRKLMNPAFSVAHLKPIVIQFHSVCRTLCSALADQIPLGEEKELDILPWLTRTALELIGQTGLGYSFDPLTREVANPFANAAKRLMPAASRLQAYQEFVSFFTSLGIPAHVWGIIISLLPIPALRELYSVSYTMDACCRDIYKEKKRAFELGEEGMQVGGGKDIISILLRANLEAPEGERMSEDEVIAQMTGIVFAATDTTTNTLCHLFHELSQRPDVQHKLRDEIKRARDGRDPAENLPYEELDALPYMDAVIRETLRLHPALSMIPRTAQKDMVLPVLTPVTATDGTQLREIVVPKGTDVFVSIRGMNRSKEYWGDDAGEWKPERFLAPLPETLLSAHVPGVYANLMTFSAGGFSCIGFKFAQLEMKAVLSQLIPRFSFAVSPKREIKWKMASIQFPTLDGARGATMPILVRRLV